MTAPRLLAAAEFALAALQPHGIDPPAGVAVVRALNNYVVGATLREAAETRAVASGGPAYQAAVTSYLRQLAASSRYPHMSTFAQILGEGGDLGPAHSFELGLQCLLDGIGRLITDRQSGQ